MKTVPGFENIPCEQQKSYLKNAAAHSPGIKNDQVIEYYNKWAKKYEQDLNENVYRGPDIVASLCNVFLHDKECKILDIGAGTGLVGKQLQKYNFQNVDGLEPSESMLTEAESKHVYRNLYKEGIDPEKPTNLPSDSYDACVVSGSFGEGHIKTEGLREITRLTKSEGYIIVVMRKEYLDYVEEYANRLEPFMSRLVDEKVWLPVIQFDVKNYFCNKTGRVFVHKKL